MVAATVDEQIQVHVTLHCRGLQQRFALQKHLVLTPPKDLCQELPWAIIPLASADQHRIIPEGGGTSMPDTSYANHILTALESHFKMRASMGVALVPCQPFVGGGEGVPEGSVGGAAL